MFMVILPKTKHLVASWAIHLWLWPKQINYHFHLNNMCSPSIHVHVFALLWQTKFASTNLVWRSLEIRSFAFLFCQFVCNWPTHTQTPPLHHPINQNNFHMYRISSHRKNRELIRTFVEIIINMQYKKNKVKRPAKMQLARRRHVAIAQRRNLQQHERCCNCPDSGHAEWVQMPSCSFIVVSFVFSH